MIRTKRQFTLYTTRNGKRFMHFGC